MTSAVGARTLLNLNWERFALHTLGHFHVTAKFHVGPYAGHLVHKCTMILHHFQDCIAMLLNRNWDPLRAPRSERASRACYSGPLPCCNMLQQHFMLHHVTIMDVIATCRAASLYY